ncbi:MAG: ABC transporter permease [Nanoarchaeota archaeon]
MKRTSLQFYGYLKKDIILLVKRKKYLYLSILLPLSIALLFLLMLSPSTGKMKIGVCDFDQTAESWSAFNNLEQFKAEILPLADCVENLKSEIILSKYSLGIVVNKGFSENLNNLKQAKITVYYDNTDIALSNYVEWKIDSSLQPYKMMIIDSLNKEMKSKVSAIRFNVDLVLELSSASTLINSKIRKIDDDLKKLEEMNTNFLVNPIWTDQQPVYEKKANKEIGITFIFPIIALFILLMLSSTSLIYDKKNYFIVRVKSATSPIVYILAKILFFVILAFAQFIIVFLLFLMFGESYNVQALEIVKLILFIGITNSLMGMLIGFVSENEGIAIMFSLIISFPLMLLSGIFSPLQTMPVAVQLIAKLLPLHHQIKAAKSVLLFSETISFNLLIPSIIMLGVLYYLMQKKKV